MTFLDHKRTPRRRPRRGAALLMSLFVIFMVSSLVLNVIDTETLQLSAARNIEDYERALYLANAAVHHACVELERDEAYRGILSEGIFPANDTYTVSTTDGDVAGTVRVRASGASGNVVRTLEATIDI